MLAGQLGGVAHLVQRERAAAARAPSHEHDDLLLGVGELQLLEEHEVHSGEALAEPAADRLRVADRQQLRRQHHR